MRLLLINPKFSESFWSFKWAREEILPGKRAINPPLGLATVAALCPPHWQIRIVDENIEPLPLAPAADLIGVCGMGVQSQRQKELLKYYRAQGYFVVAGGSYASLCPDDYAAVAHSVIAGEAEYIWPRFCADFERGAPLPLYRETGTVDLIDSPVPRFDLLRLDQYTTATLQFSRGCPYRCEFCDIIVMFGRRPRHKSLPQVSLELDALRRHGVRNVFFVDDNLIGNKAVAKELLRFLAQYQTRHDYRFSFGTEASLNLAQDDELLGLFRAASFGWVFIGIESTDVDTLKAARKTQNTQQQPLAAVRKIYAYGIDVLAGFIVGFDSDTEATFDEQYRFIMESGIQAAMIGLLTALPGTPLYQRVLDEGRLIATAANSDNTQRASNIVPKRMTYAAMIAAYERLYQRLLTPRSIAARINAKQRYLSAPVYHGEYTPWQRWRIAARLLGKGVLRRGPSAVLHFLSTIPWRAPVNLPMVILDWIAGLSMADYVKRRFAHSGARELARASKLARQVQAVARRYLISCRVELQSRAASAAPDLMIRLGDSDYGDFLHHAARYCKRFLRRTSATLTLRIEMLRDSDLPGLQRLLERLARFGDRIYIVVGAALRQRIAIDSSRFNLILAAD